MLPWVMVLVDLGAVAGLWLTKPTSLLPPVLDFCTIFRRAGLTGLALFAALGSGLFLWQESNAGPLLAVSTARLDLGTISADKSVQADFWLTNSSPAPVTLGKITSSCACLQIVLEKTTLAPDERVSALVRLDLAQEAAFTGELKVQVVGATEAGQVAFFLVVTAQVAKAWGHGALNEP